jgi:hypothetical protein
MDDMDRIREDFIILLLGAKDKPIPTMWHIQKELFILSKVNPKIQQLFEFQPHYEGPYSDRLRNQLEEPLYYNNPYTYDSKIGYFLLSEGKKRYNELLKNYSDIKLKQLLNGFKLIRTLYDKLSKDELLFLMYITYPNEFIELSNIYEKLEKKRNELVHNIYKKGLFTEKKLNELIRNGK